MGGTWRSPDNPYPLDVARVAHPQLRVAGGAEALRAYRRHNLVRPHAPGAGRAPCQARASGPVRGEAHVAGGFVSGRPAAPQSRFHNTTKQRRTSWRSRTSASSRRCCSQSHRRRRNGPPSSPPARCGRRNPPAPSRIAALAGGDALLFAKVAHPAEEPEGGPLGDRAPRHRCDEVDELVQVEVPVVLLASLHNARLLLRCPPKLSRVLQEVDVA
jgi:hypothetical protein